MTDIDIILNKHNPKLLAKRITENFKKARISQNITQEVLAERSGVALSSLKRFEQKAEISLVSLLKMAIVLDTTSGFENLFIENGPTTIDEVLKANKSINRRRARKK